MSRLQAAIDTVERLTLDEQESVVDILKRRLLEKRRARLLREIEEAEAEHDAGLGQKATPAQIMAELRS